MKTIQDALHRLEAGASTLEGIYRVFAAHADSPCAQFDHGGEVHRISFAEYDRRIRRAAANLQAMLGVPTVPKFIGICMDNEPEYFTVFWGVVMAGYQPVLLDIHADEKRIAHIVKQTAAIAVITRAAACLPAGVTDIAVSSLLRVRDAEPGGAFADRLAFCTSGTVSSSKVFVYDGLALTNTLYDLAAFQRDNPSFADDRPCRVLAFLPFSHIFGFLTTVLIYPAAGKTIVFLKDRSNAAIQDACRVHRVTHLFCVPLFWDTVSGKLLHAAKAQGKRKEAMLKHMIEGACALQRRFPRSAERFCSIATRPLRRKMLGTHVTCAISGGGHILPETLKTLNGVGYPLVNGYGMTELGITSVQRFNRIDEQCSGCIGRPFAGVTYRIRPIDEKNPHIGELLVKSSAMHIGRMENGEMLPPELDANGYFATGDIARMENGSAWLEGRVKEVIICENGENVYPDELEEAFVDLAGVKNVCVFGMEATDTCACITLIVYMGAGVPEDAIADLTMELVKRNTQLPMHKRVRRCYLSLDPLPLTASMKVRRQTARAELAAGSMPVIELDLKHCRTSAVGATVPEQDPVFAQTLSRIKALFAEELGMDAECIGDGAHFVYELGGDSLAALGIVARIQDRFGVAITAEEYGKCACAEEVALLLCNRQNTQDPERNAPAADMPKLARPSPFMRAVFRGCLAVLRLFIRRPELIDRTDGRREPGILIANHCALMGPVIYMLYYPHAFTPWAKHELCEGFSTCWRYYANVRRNHTGRSGVCAALPVTFFSLIVRLIRSSMAYIPAYEGLRFASTIAYSLDALHAGGHVLVFPETPPISHAETPDRFLPGFVVLAEKYRERFGRDVPIYPICLMRRENRMILGKPLYLRDFAAGEGNADAQRLAKVIGEAINGLRT